ncbi:MAG: ribonuclease, partial [Burkholderiales bacterium]
CLICVQRSNDKPTEKRSEGQTDVAVQIQGVWVRPGDWLVADEDGMVVLAQMP